MVLGAVMLIDSPLPEMRIHLSTAIALALPFSLITMFLLSLVVRARRNKVVTGSRGHDRRNRHGRYAARAGRQGLRARRILECGGAGRRWPPAARAYASPPSINSN